VGQKRIGLREIRALKPSETIWDATVAGFGARRQRSSGISYMVIYRTEGGRQRWFTIGRHGSPWTTDTAREEARRILGDVAYKRDPAAEKTAARKVLTVSQLCHAYLADAQRGRVLTRQRESKKASTISIDRGRIERHIEPLLGRLAVNAVTCEDIEAFMHDVAEGKTAGKTKTKRYGLANVRGGKATASRTVGLLGAIFTYAVKHRMRPDNPAHGIARYADVKRERRLTDNEYKALKQGLLKSHEAGIWPWAIGLVRFLALSGWRSGEARGLRWSELDLPRRTATLADTKTGRSLRPLAHAACDVLTGLPRSGGDLVFPATRGPGQMVGFPKLWVRIAKLGDLSTDVTPHTLRHSFASLAGDLGYSESTIAALVGHRGSSVTSRYVHTADAVLLAAADAVADRTLALMGQAAPGAQVIPLRA
jgi:integrase